MEKELIINGVKYVKLEEPKRFEVYDLVKYNGYRWIIINVEDNKLTLMMRNCLSEEKMKKIFDNDYLDSDGGIKYNLDKICNDWNKTEIKRGLNNEFLKEFNKNELVKMKTKYDENRYSFDYIRIPKIREIERLDPDRIEPNKSSWTMSPSEFDDALVATTEWNQYSVDYIHPWAWWAWVDDGYGVRPVITIKSDNPNIKKVGRV